MTQKATRADWIKFISVMVIFMIGMIILIINQIKNPWIWVVYIAVWTWAELKIAKNIHLKWWVWVLILSGLSVVDYVVLQLIG